jgi:hypothetical protein
MIESQSLFSQYNNDSKSEQTTFASMSGRIDAVEMAFIGAESTDWQSLFSGFNKLYAITYSSGVGFVSQLLKMFEYAEIIFGSEEVMNYSLQEVMAFQIVTINKLREVQDKKKAPLSERIKNNSLKMLVAREKMSHEKTYLLEAEDGRKRVIFGSANMSFAAFSGKQRENICYIDGDKAFDWYKSCFDDLKEKSSDNISVEALSIADAGENADEIPVMQTVRMKKAMVIEPQNEFKEDVRFVLDVKNLAGKFAPLMPKADKRGKIALSPEMVIQTRRRIADATTKEKELRSEYPQLVIDIENQEVILNDNTLNLSPSEEEVKKDITLFMEYMEGYEKFHGDVIGMQHKYYAFANWFFVSPFMAIMRDMASRYNQNLLPYPVFGLLYGQSKAGKTSFLMTLLTMMIGQKPRISAQDFTRSSIDGLKRTVKGAPIIVDDLTNTRFGQHAIETIKNDDFGVNEGLVHYPVVVISANEDVKAVAAEVTRRTVICHVQAGLTNTEVMQSSIVRRVHKNIGTAFYQKYLGIMLDKVPDLIEEIKDDDNDRAPDILEVSSQIIYQLISTYYSGPIPEFVRNLSLEDYFSEKVTGSQAIKTIQRAWNVNKKAFQIDKRYGQLRYNAGAPYEADRILKELPESLEAHKSREWIVMDLEQACDYFEVDFKKGNGLLNFLR